MKFVFTVFLGLFLSLFAAHDARAELAPPARTVFALIVTSNHGASGARPDLHYADDDGVKYLELFKMLAPEGNVVLHTELDPDTERLYPWASAVARPPTKAAVAASVAELGLRAAAVMRAGGATDFYFIFAGHGDVDAGVGFLELRDARFTSQDLESMLRTVGATQSNVILDSCNSFFVVNARKPGGHPVSTTADEARSLSERLSNVGVFLSTSSEAEVFEWSELQAGIFSHAVRSGLTGAADANGDGVVSYDELRTFVSVASARIKNPVYRPKVFARGPGANSEAPIVRLSATHGTALRIDGPQVRLTLRDADDIPLVDLHKESGASVTLRLPERWATHAFAEERDANAPTVGPKRLTLDAPRAEQPIALADLPSASPVGEARGASDVFRMLFAVPFGPKAMAEGIAEVRKEDAAAVYGVSEDDVERMRVLLAQGAGDVQGRRITVGAAQVAFGAVLGAAGGWLATREDTSKTAYPYLLLGYGALFAGFGTWDLLRTSEAEELNRTYGTAVQSSDPSLRAAAVANAERGLFHLRERARAARGRERVLGFVWIGLGATTLALDAILPATKSVASTSSDEMWEANLVAGSALALGATQLVSSFVPYPIERLADVWESDPGRAGGQNVTRTLPSVSFAPTRGGAALHLAWNF